MFHNFLTMHSLMFFPLSFYHILNLAERSKPSPLLDFSLARDIASCLRKIHFQSFWVSPCTVPQGGLIASSWNVPDVC